MTKIFDDWSADTLDAAPSASRWTPYGFASTAGYWTGKVKDLGSSIRAVSPRDNGHGAPGWGDYHVGYTRVEPGTYDPDEGASEFIDMVSVFRFPSGQGGWEGGLRWGNYYAVPIDNSRWAICSGFGGGYAAGTGALTYTVTANTWWCARFRRMTGGVFKLKLWQYGTSEPDDSSWNITSSADTGTTTGAFGVFAYQYLGAVDYRLVGIATGSEVAPLSAPAAGVTITDAGDESFMVGETMTITCTGAGASQGAGRVVLSPTDDIDDAGAIELTVSAWSDTEVQAVAALGGLSFLTNVYLFIENNGGTSNTSGYVVQFIQPPALMGQIVT